MHAHLFRAIAALMLSLALAACAGSANTSGAKTDGAKTGGTRTISAKTWGHYQSYLADIGTTSPGAFAVSENGRAAFYVYCKDVRCASGTAYKHDAVRRCRDLSGQDCYVFAFRRDIEVAYKVAD